MGTAVFGGMLFATVLSLFLVPSLYIMIKSVESFFNGDEDKGSSSSGGSRKAKRQRDRPVREPDVELTTKYKLDKSSKNS